MQPRIRLRPSVSQIGILFPRYADADEWVGARREHPVLARQPCEGSRRCLPYSRRRRADPAFVRESPVPAMIPRLRRRSGDAKTTSRRSTPAAAERPLPGGRPHDAHDRGVGRQFQRRARFRRRQSNAVAKVFDDLHVTKATNSTVGGDSPQEYSRFFRVLYNGSYIQPSGLRSGARPLEPYELYAGPRGRRAGERDGRAQVRRIHRRHADPWPTIPRGTSSMTAASSITPVIRCFLCVMTRGSRSSMRKRPPSRKSHRSHGRKLRRHTAHQPVRN